MPSNKLELTISTLDVLIPIAKAVPVLGSRVEGSLEVAKKILEYAQGVQKNKKDTIELALEAAAWAKDIANAAKGSEEDVLKLRSLEADVKSFFEVLEKIASFLSEKTGKSALKGFLLSAKQKAQDAEKLTGLRKELKSVYERFTTKSLMRTEIAVQKIVSKAEIENMLNVLSPVFSAVFDSRESPDGCMPGTRTDILRSLNTWAEEPTTALSIFWLSGMAGTGKSAIAKSFCGNMSSSGRLAASFFVSRQSALRSDPHRIVRTLAHEFAKLHPMILNSVCEAAQNRPDLTDRSMEEQISLLIVGPLTKYLSLSDTAKIVIVIDALDECSNKSACTQLVRLLTSLLSQCPIKLILTSRNEKYLQDAFASFPHDYLKLHDLEQSIVSADIRHFFEVSLTRIARERRISTLDWPSTTDVDRLTEAAGYLFIYAATVVGYVQQSRFDPKEQLADVFAMAAGSSGNSPDFSPLDVLYRHILKAATAKDDTRPNDRLVSRVQRLLAILLTVEEPVDVATLAGLADCTVLLTVTDCEALNTVLRVPEDVQESSEPITIFHPSFPDFLRNPERCNDTHLLIDGPSSDAYIASRSLRVMNEQLVRDDINMDTSWDGLAELWDGLAELQQHFAAELRYACLYWHRHLSRCASSDDELLCRALRAFVEQSIPQWITALYVLSVFRLCERALYSFYERSDHKHSEPLVMISITARDDVVSLLQEWACALRAMRQGIAYVR